MLTLREAKELLEKERPEHTFGKAWTSFPWLDRHCGRAMKRFCVFEKRKSSSACSHGNKGAKTCMEVYICLCCGYNFLAGPDGKS